MHAKQWAMVLLAILLMGALASCAPATTPPETDNEAAEAEATEAPEVEETEAPEAEETEAPEATEAVEPTEQPTEVVEEGEGGIAVLIFTQEFDTLSPIYTNMWFSAITQQFWNHNAWEFDDNNEPFPVLVTEIPSSDNGGISEDGRTITITLRDDIVWSDGEPITSDDFVFTYEMIMDDNNSVSSRHPYDLVESIEAPDERTVVLTFTEPFAPWLTNIWNELLPAHILRPVFEAEGTLDEADWNTAPTVSAGPYVFAEWESGSFARFVRNENYWGDRPNIDEIFIQFVQDDASQIAALLAGDGDLGTFIAYSDIPALEAEGIEVVKVNSGYNEGFYFYLDPENGHPAMQDVRVRQAIALGIDREAINRDLLLGLTEPAVTLWDNTPFQDPSLEPWPYDPERAQELLDEAGWVDSNGDGTRDKDGVELVLIYGTTTREIRQDTQAVVQEQLAEIGIGIELQSVDPDLFFDTYANGGTAATGQYDMFEYSTVTAFPDPDTADFRCAEIPSDENPEGTNWAALCDEELDALFAEQATQVDPAEREATFHEISSIIYENVYWLGLWNDPDIWVVSPRLQNVRLSGVTPFFNVTEWTLAGD